MERFTNLQATLWEVQEWLLERLDDGVVCPCCKQYAQVYKRRLNAAMAYVLVLIEKWHADQDLPVGKTEWLHVPSHIAKEAAANPGRAAAVRGDWAKLKHWDLIEEQPSQRGDGSRRVGYYRITQRGIDFVRGVISVQAYIWIYNEVRLERTVTERITIREAMGVKFNYQDLMAGR